MLRRIALAAALLTAALVTPSGPPAGAFTIWSGVMVYTAGPGGDGFLHPDGLVPKSVSGGYQPVVGNFVGDPTEDVLWYAAGPDPDYLWEMGEDGSHTSRALTINGTYEPLAGFFSERSDLTDSHDDIFWYAPGTAPDPMWDFNDDGSVTKSTKAVNGYYHPVKGHFLPAPDDTGDDILWLADDGQGQSTMWDFNRDGTVTKAVHHLGAWAEPLVFSTGAEDAVFLYRPGPRDDHIVNFLHGSVVVRNVSGSYLPVVGHFDATPGEDILWYAPGTRPDTQWSFNGTTFVTFAARTINGLDYWPVVGDFGGGYEEILWFRPGQSSSSIWTFGPGTSYTTRWEATPNGATAFGVRGVTPTL